MTTGCDSNLSVSPTEERLLSALRREGPQSLDGLCAWPVIGVSQGLLVVDRLSRAGVVSIELVRPCDDRVSLVKEERR